MKLRQNQKTARLIDASINVLREHGLYVATRMLCEAGVPPETAVRVLRHPGQRRMSDNSVTH